MKPVSNNIFFDDIAKQIADGKQVRIRAKGNSMLPFIRDGKDAIILQKLTTPVKNGMLLLAKSDTGNYVIHRVEKVDTDKIILRGDGNLTQREVCRVSQIIANVMAVVRNGKTITEGSFQWNLYRLAWPGNYFLRKVLLAVFRRWEKW